MVNKNISIYQNFLAVAKERGNAPALYYENHTTSYRSLLLMINRFTAFYHKFGLKAGDLITLVAPNTPEAVACFFAASQAGIQIHLLHPLTIQENILKEFRDKDSKLLVTVSVFLNGYDKLLAEKLPILVLDPTDSLNVIKRVGFSYLAKEQLTAYKAHKELLHYRKDVLSLKAEEAFEDYQAKTGRIILSSGGTTGVSKSILLSDFAFDALLENSLWILQVKDIKEVYNNTMLAVLPMFHGFGLAMGVMALLLHGGRVALMAKFHTKPVIKLLKQKRITYMIGVPAIYEALLKNPNFKGDLLKPLLHCWVGGDFISPSLLERFNQRLKEAGSKGMLMEGYGLTETVTVLSVNRLYEHKEGTIGKTLPNVEVKILDENHNPVNPNVIGEIAITGETLMNGYIHEEDPFYEMDGKKWVLSGDIGKMDEEGYVYFVSRKKRVIKKKGLNIYPLALEKRVSSIKGVLECAYLGETYQGKDYTGLFVALNEGYDMEETKKIIQETLEKEFNSYELPDFILPKTKFKHTNVGKIDYVVLKDEFHQYLLNQ